MKILHSELCSNVRQFHSAERIIQLIFKLHCSLFGRVLSTKTSGLHTVYRDTFTEPPGPCSTAGTLSARPVGDGGWGSLGGCFRPPHFMGQGEGIH